MPERDTAVTAHGAPPPGQRPEGTGGRVRGRPATPRNSRKDSTAAQVTAGGPADPPDSADSVDSTDSADSVDSVDASPGIDGPVTTGSAPESPGDPDAGAPEEATGDEAEDPGPAAEPTLTAAYASATELREALEELRRVLDVEEVSQPRRRRGPWLLLALLVLALVAGLAIRQGVLDRRAVAIDGGTAGAPTSPVTPSATPSAASTGQTATSPAASPTASGGLTSQPVQAPVSLPSSGPGITTPGTVVTVAIDTDPDASQIDVYEQALFAGPGLDALPLAQPSLRSLLGDVAGLKPQVSDIQVVLDGQVARAVPAGDGSWVAVPPQGGRFTRAEVRYTVSDSVARSTPSLPGRALIAVTPLTGSQAMRDGLPVLVRFDTPVVQGVSCPSAPLADSLCAAHRGNTWTARLPASATSAIVLAQVNLNPPI